MLVPENEAPEDGEGSGAEATAAATPDATPAENGAPAETDGTAAPAEDEAVTPNN